MTHPTTGSERADNLADTFGAIYREHRWGDIGIPFYSGTGSHDPAIVAPYVLAVRSFARRFARAPSVVDLGCGDFNIGCRVRDVFGDYIACDVVADLIDYNRDFYADFRVDFRVHDLRLAPIPECDIVFVRQVFQHLSNADIAAGLAHIVGRAKYLVVTEHLPATDGFVPNLDKPSGVSIREDFGSGVVLTAAPFEFQPVATELLCEVVEYSGVLRTWVYTLEPTATEGLEPPREPHPADEVFLLESHHGSFVTAVPGRADLLHSMPIRDLGVPLVFRRIAGRIHVDPQVSRLNATQLAAWADLEIIEGARGLPKDAVVLRRQGGFVSAEPTQPATALRHVVSDWEIFRKRPLHDTDLAGVPGQRVPTWRRGSAIPRLVHQTFPTASLPDAVSQAVATVRALNPDFSHKLWIDAEIADFIHDHYGLAVRNAFLRINPVYGAARADLFRYLCLYRFGGVYLDIKSSMLMPLSRILQADDRYLLSQWRPGPGGGEQWWGEHGELYNVEGGEFQQWHIIAAPGHAFLESVINLVLANIETYHPRYAGVGKLAVLRVTGPVAYTLGILPHLTTEPHRWFAATESLVYSAVGNHAALFPRHYSALDEPVILPHPT